MIKLTVKFEIDEETLGEILKSYDVKPTKGNMTKLRRDMKQNCAEDDFALNLSEDFELEIGEWISNMDWEDKELIND